MFGLHKFVSTEFDCQVIFAAEPRRTDGVTSEGKPITQFATGERPSATRLTVTDFVSTMAPEELDDWLVTTANGVISRQCAALPATATVTKQEITSIGYCRALETHYQLVHNDGDFKIGVTQADLYRGTRGYQLAAIGYDVEDWEIFRGSFHFLSKPNFLSG